MNNLFTKVIYFNHHENVLWEEKPLARAQNKITEMFYFLATIKKQAFS